MIENTLLTLLALYIVSTGLVYLFGRWANSADRTSTYDLGRMAASGSLSSFDTSIRLSNALMWLFVIARAGISFALLAIAVYGAGSLIFSRFHIDLRVFQEFWNENLFLSLGAIAITGALVALISFAARRRMSDYFMDSFRGFFTSLFVVPFLAVVRWTFRVLSIGGLLAVVVSTGYGVWRYFS